MKKFNKILCFVNPENVIDAAVVQALRMANDYQSSLTFITVLNIASSSFFQFFNENQADKKIAQILESKRQEIETKIFSIAPSIHVDLKVIPGVVFLETIKYVIHNQYDLVIKCADNPTWIERILSSDDMHLLRKCPCPVLLLNPNHTDKFKNIMATIDVSEDEDEEDSQRVQDELNQYVLEYTHLICSTEMSNMHVGSVWSAFAEDLLRYNVFNHQTEEELTQYVEQTRLNTLVRFNLLLQKVENQSNSGKIPYENLQLHLKKGEAPQEIPLMIKKYDIDLVVMGTVGRVGVPGLIIGNTAESILEQIKCSILAVKPEGFKSPVE